MNIALRYFLVAALVFFGLAGPSSSQDDDAYTANPSLIPPNGLTVYYNSQGPLSFVSMTPHDIPADAIPIGEVQTHSCQYKISIPLSLSFRATNVSGAQGNGSYQKALEELQLKLPDLAGIYDVKEDLHVTSVLGIFQRVCTEITARGFKRSSRPS